MFNMFIVINSNRITSKSVVTIMINTMLFYGVSINVYAVVNFGNLLVQVKNIKLRILIFLQIVFVHVKLLAMLY